MKTWWLLALLTAVFGVLGTVLTVLAFTTGERVLLVGAVFLVFALVMGWFVPGTRREQDADRRQAPAAAPGSVPFERVAEMIRERFAGTPYTVELTGSRIRVHADLADAEFLTWAAARKVRVVRVLDVVAGRDGTATTRDLAFDLEITAGVARIRGSAKVMSGRSWSRTRRIEHGIGRDGSVGRQVDVDFSTTDLREPVEEVLEETGWKAGWWASLPAEAKGGLVVAVLAVVGTLGGFLVIGVLALTGNLP